MNTSLCYQDGIFPRTANKNRYLRPNQDPDLQLVNILTSLWVVMISII